jgi:hypothetical protein
MTFRLLTIPALLILAFFVSPLSQAADEAEAKRLITAYTDALGTNDLEQVKTAWHDLNNSPESVEYMQKNMPRLHYMFQVRGLYFQVDNIDVDEKSTVQQEGQESTSTPPPESGRETKAQVEHFSVSEAQTGRPLTNGEIAERAKDAVLRDNRDIAIGNPNQNRQDNQTLIQNRAQAHHNQKFQKAPQVLVPASADEGSLP